MVVTNLRFWIFLIFPGISLTYFPFISPSHFFFLSKFTADLNIFFRSASFSVAFFIPFSISPDFSLNTYSFPDLVATMSNTPRITRTINDFLNFVLRFSCFFKRNKNELRRQIMSLGIFPYRYFNVLKVPRKSEAEMGYLTNFYWDSHQKELKKWLRKVQSRILIHSADRPAIEFKFA